MIDETIKYAKQAGSSLTKRNWSRRFLISGLVLSVLVLLYRLLVYASYLEVNEARFSDKGGSMTIHVETDAVLVSLQVHSGEWFTITQSGKNIIVDVKENKGARERQTSFTVFTGVIDGLCKAKKEVTIVQIGKDGATEDVVLDERPEIVLEKSIDSIASAYNLNQANSIINRTLQLFASSDVPVFIIICQMGDVIEYDRPTTIENYLNYVKDHDLNSNRISKLKYNEAGKIIEVELAKK